MDVSQSDVDGATLADCDAAFDIAARFHSEELNRQVIEVATRVATGAIHMDNGLQLPGGTLTY